jgi:hypothetical protein
VQRFAAWAYTGPLGHLYGGIADSVELFARFARARALARVRARS